jgi:hypothetical protein
LREFCIGDPPFEPAPREGIRRARAAREGAVMDMIFSNKTNIVMNQPIDVLISVSVLVKGLPRGDETEDLINGIADRMERSIDQELSQESLQWSRECTAFDYLDGIGDQNARRCHYCQTWATDQTKLRAIRGLMPGAELDGRWVCDQCFEKHDRIIQEARRRYF